ncbi:MAG: hypothetical protein NTW66_02485 [Candidatus Magasanikbacteria bacterium]|nr:hypothetical protein [Candidatus Magasanikbacteria bacterium]
MFHIIIGLLLVAAGTVLIFKTEWFVQNFGTIAWAENNLGTSGGSRLFYKLIGLVLIFVGMLAATNLMTSFLMGTVGKLLIR